MNLPQINHPRIKYRNGKTGFLLTTSRKNTIFTTMTITEENNSVIHHLPSGGYLMNGRKHELDIVEVE